MRSGPFSEKRLNFVRGAGRAALGEAVPAAAPAMEGGVHGLDLGTDVLSVRPAQGVGVMALLSGENSARPPQVLDTASISRRTLSGRMAGWNSSTLPFPACSLAMDSNTDSSN